MIEFGTCLNPDKGIDKGTVPKGDSPPRFATPIIAAP